MFSKRFNLLSMVASAFCIQPHMGNGTGRGDASTGYTSTVDDAQVGFGFDKQLFVEARIRTIVGALSQDGAAGGAVSDMYAGSGPSLDGSAVIKRKKITEGGFITETMEEAFTGLPTYGDAQHPAGDFVDYKNIRVYVNTINSPAMPIQGKNVQRRVKMSIENLPARARENVINWAAEEMEIQALYSLIYAASPSILKAGADLNFSPGVNAGAGVGTPLMNEWWYTKAGGLLTYNTTPATWNSTVNTAVQSLAASSSSMIALSDIQVIRSILDDKLFWPITFNGKKYKALALCDTDLWHRLHNLMGNSFLTAMPRGWDNPLYSVDYVLEYDGFMFIPVPNMKKLRPAYNATNGYPDFGPSMTQDHRNYSTSSYCALIQFVTTNAIFEGYDNSIKVVDSTGRFGKGMDIAAELDLGYVRGEWYSKTGRTDANAVKNYSCLTAAFYEPGVGSSYT
jgi:hypothetical protein